MTEKHKYDGFKIICENCGSDDVYVWQDGYDIKLVCNNYPVCGKETFVLKIQE
jgi:ssDNA-binding Zn-finger/Zn-ribbon topoisomerase 1